MTPNHLDHHKDMDEYINAKRNILLYQSETGVAILNAENEITKKMSGDVNGELRWFSSKNRVSNGTYMDRDKNLVKVKDGKETIIMNLNDIKLRGEHNKENVTTAAAAVLSLVPDDNIKKTASEFSGVSTVLSLFEARRRALVQRLIGTSPTRTIAGLRSFDEKLILIAGGYDKKDILCTACAGNY